jgi:hypothetical protein
MFDQLNQALEDYFGKWGRLVEGRKNKEFFERLKPTAVGWKTTDLAEFDRLFAEWRQACDQIHIGLINDRWIASMHIKDTKLHGDIEIIKLMQRRPDSTDAVGLDHVDFLDMEETNTKAVLAEEDGLKTSEEKNGYCEWTSIWFDGTEAKLRLETVLDVGIAELRDVNNKIRGEKFEVPAPNGVHAYVSEVE